MSYTPFLVANFKVGLDREVEPWILPEQAFSEVRNAYLRRGVWNKRNGYTLFRKFAEAQGLILIISIAGSVVTVNMPLHGFTTGDTVFITNVVGMTQVNNKSYTITVVDVNNFTLDNQTGAGWSPYVSGGIVYYYPNLPIMGLQTYIKNDGNKQLCVFNTRRMGVFDPSNNTDTILAISGAYNGGTNRFGDFFTGDDSNFFWTENYRSSTTVTDNKLYITNNVDPVHTWDGTTLAPYVIQYGATGADVVDRCAFIFAFKQRLVLLATQENGTLRPQRARWCQAQNPTIWRDDIPGQGGFVDAPTGDFIIAAAFLKDILIVQFTNSWWMLRPTSDPALPFRWDKIATNRSVNAPFASLSYDKSVTGFGQSGILESNGVDVNRIDDKIPDFITEEVNQVNFNKMYGKRYLQQQQTWTLYPYSDSTVSNQILVLNEQEGSWSQYDLSLSCLGYVDNNLDPAWQDYQEFADDPSASLPPYVWSATPGSGEEDFGNSLWISSFFQSGSELFIGGSHDGIIYRLDDGASDFGSDINMEMLTARWNPYKDQGIAAQMGYVDFLIDSDPVTEVQIEFFVNNDTAPYKTQNLNFLPQNVYVGDIAGITQTNPAVVNVYNHNLDTSDTVYVYQTTGMESLSGNSFTITVINDDNFQLNGVDATGFSPYLGNGNIVKGNFEGLKTWKRVFAGAIGFAHRMRLTNNASDQPVRIHAIMPWFRPAGNRMIGL